VGEHRYPRCREQESAIVVFYFFNPDLGGVQIMSEYLSDVQRYDAGADADVVQKIVKHLGIALRSKDASMVSCSDKSELGRVTEKWCMKKKEKLISSDIKKRFLDIR